jgi:hypothetical protein
VLKTFSFAVVALVLFAGSAWAGDELSASDIDLSSVSDANNVVVGASLDVDVDGLAKSADKVDEAVEACYRGFGYGGYGGCYNYCYNYCYTPCYHYCAPVYTYYRPVVYSYCYTPIYTTYHTLSYWGCH